MNVEFNCSADKTCKCNATTSMEIKPQTSYNDIITELNKLASNKSSSQFEVASVRRKVEKLKKVSALEAYMALGALASIQNNYDELQVNYNAAFNITRAEPEVWHSYVTSLSKMGLISEAAKASSDFINKSNGDKGALFVGIKYAMFSCSFKEAAKYISLWDKLSPEEPHENSGVLYGVLDVMEESAPNESDVQDASRIVYSTLIESGAYWHYDYTSISILEDNESKWINYCIEIDESEAEVAELNFKLSEKISSESFSSTLMRYFVPIFEPMADRPD